MKGITKTLAPPMDEPLYYVHVKIGNHDEVKVAWYFDEQRAKDIVDEFNKMNFVKARLEYVDPLKDLEDYEVQPREDID